MMMRASDHQLNEVEPDNPNQANIRFRRFGPKRMRALELLKQLIQTVTTHTGKANDLTQKIRISVILRHQIVTALLDAISEFEFSNVANQLGIQVLDILKMQFDETDIELLKNFVMKHLNHERAYIKFADSETGQHRQATRGHLAAVIKMALVLKKLTLDGGMQA